LVFGKGSLNLDLSSFLGNCSFYCLYWSVDRTYNLCGPKMLRKPRHLFKIPCVKIYVPLMTTRWSLKAKNLNFKAA